MRTRHDKLGPGAIATAARAWSGFACTALMLGLTACAGTITATAPTCADGVISGSGCSCGGTIYTGGYCCAGVHGTASCPGASACGGGAIAATCLCGGTPHADGHCCSDEWQPSPCPAAAILWTDDIQGGGSPWGFDGLATQRPIGTDRPPDDATGVNLSRVADPAGGGGFALRHYATFDVGGSRSQTGIYGFANSAFGDQARRPEGVWVAQEWYFPAALSAGGDPYLPWISLWDWHSTDDGGGNRWHTSPGLFLHTDGSMRVYFGWGGWAGGINPDSGPSTIALPVGRWFDIEMHYLWVDTPTATLSLWIDGQLALQQTGVQTREPQHAVVETYAKFYGSTQGGPAWVPTPSVRHTRNVRVAGERIWR